MIEHDFDIAKKTVAAIRGIEQKEILSVPPFSSSAVEHEPTQLKVKVEEPEEEQETRKFTRSSSSTPNKRVRESATGPGKRWKVLVPPVPRKIVVIKDDDSTMKKKAWKPRVERVNEEIIQDGDFTKMNKYYDLYDYSERLNLENYVLKYMILANKKFDTIQGKNPDDLFKKLVNRKMRAQEEDKTIRENMVKKLCVVKDDVHLE